MDEIIVSKIERETIQTNWNPIESSDQLIQLLNNWKQNHVMSNYHYNTILDEQII